MKKINKKKKRRNEKLLFVTVFTAVILVVSTYAWFIGITQVQVNSFEVEVVASEGLTISLDGLTFSNSISIDEDAIGEDLEEDYSTHTNSWPETGLNNVSTVGAINTTYSRLTLFNKSSMTSSAGGYKLKADLVDNSSTEQDGYLVFDIFLKNSSGGSFYNPTYTAAEEEGIYLMQSSAVGTSGQGGEDGLQNSIRVAFFEIGRVNHTTNDGETIQGITCNVPAQAGGDPADEDVTGLCNVGPQSSDGKGYTWNIWEPNDTIHTEASLTHFNRICKKRTGANTYTTVCDPISGAVTTYAVNAAVTSADNVDIYDGLNDYESISSKLTGFDYFTDTEKTSIVDSGRVEFMYLAPNSITKVRVYVYMEGQDIDNYDLNFTKTIRINFGFTKDKFEGISSNNEEEPEPTEP